jgi:radical SAM protein with 4Fe4S-binding SPASM domain
MREKYGIKHSMPPSLEITTAVGCPLMCTFCPQKALTTNYGKQKKYLSVSDFKKVLKKIPNNTEIHFSGMTEPWTNPNCTEMLEISLKMGFKVAIYSTLYGISLSDAKLISNLLRKYDAQIVTLCLHLPDANNNMKGWRYSEEWEDVFKIISTTNVSCGTRIMTMDGSGNIHPDIKNLTNVTEKFNGHSRADSLDLEQIGSQKIMETPRHTSKITCASTPFYDKNVLLPNGDIVLCCMDFSYKHIIGNLLKSSYEDIFKNNEFLKIVKVNESEGFSKCSICKSCYNVTKIGFKSKLTKFIPKPLRQIIQ